jgi:hypothetical protein
VIPEPPDWPTRLGEAGGDLASRRGCRLTPCCGVPESKAVNSVPHDGTGLLDVVDHSYAPLPQVNAD